MDISFNKKKINQHLFFKRNQMKDVIYTEWIPNSKENLNKGVSNGILVRWILFNKFYGNCGKSYILIVQNFINKLIAEHRLKTDYSLDIEKNHNQLNKQVN